MVESVLTSRSVPLWKFEDNSEDKQATSLLHFKGNRGGFFHGANKNIGTGIEMFQLSSSVLLSNWRNCCFVLP